MRIKSAAYSFHAQSLLGGLLPVSPTAAVFCTRTAHRPHCSTTQLQWDSRAFLIVARL
jgi:hypothetical protein